MTRRDHYGNRRRSWRRETDQLFEEMDYILDRAQEVSKEHGIPIETVMASFGLASAKGSSTDAKKEGAKDNVPHSNDEQRSGDAGGVGADD